MNGKKVLDVGSGFAVDSITFAQHGAQLTFCGLQRAIWPWQAISAADPWNNRREFFFNFRDLESLQVLNPTTISLWHMVVAPRAVHVMQL